jgi:hypothetical protein
MSSESSFSLSFDYYFFLSSLSPFDGPSPD